MRFFEVSANGSAADVVLVCKLGCGLFVTRVVVPEVVRVEACTAQKLPLAIAAFVLLFMIFCTVFPGMF